MHYKKYWDQEKEKNKILQQEVSLNKSLAEKIQMKAETLETELASYKNTSVRLKSDFEYRRNIEEQKHSRVVHICHFYNFYLHSDIKIAFSQNFELYLINLTLF